MYDPVLLESGFSRWGIPLGGSHFLVAFSGGLDSTVLAQSMSWLAEKHDFALTLGHVNHRLRPDSDDDEHFCHEFAASRGIPFLTVSLSPSELNGESVEAWARRERYAALEDMRLQAGAQWILTAHHADDQAETVLMRLIQQAPLLCLAGIRSQRGKILRPLLSFTRAQLCQWAKQVDLVWVDDQSNFDERFIRNRLRNQLMLATMNGQSGSRDTLLGLANLAQEYESHCANIARETANLAFEGTLPGTVLMPVCPLLAADDDIFKLVVGDILKRFFGIMMSLSTPHWQNLRHFVRAGTVGKIFELPRGVQVLMDRERLVFYRRELASAPDPVPLELGTTEWSHHRFLVTYTETQPGTPNLWIRSWKPGDRARLRSGSHLKLLSDIYIDARLNRLEKTHWPLVVTDQDEVVWIPGLTVPHNCLERTPWRITWLTQSDKK
ncbi:MAG: tRNA lysidine(34) synthetase TilS [Fidelibacterota bacterium]|nr:MAG: tRNA lysidine(34) synthetase TilS [Candidatus Neomarinimicrobiota bacterium]